MIKITHPSSSDQNPRLNRMQLPQFVFHLHEIFFSCLNIGMQGFAILACLFFNRILFRYFLSFLFPSEQNKLEYFENSNQDQLYALCKNLQAVRPQECRQNSE